MCISMWSTENTLGHRLILASNRDEFFHRPSSNASWHSFHQINHHSQVPPTPPPSSSEPLFQLNSAPISSNPERNHSDNDFGILSGRDLRAGGTWLGINKHNGKFGFLTNVTPVLDVRPDADEPGALDQADSSPESSRGNIIRDFLQSDEGVESHITKLKSSRSTFNMCGFNLVIGQLGKTEGQEDKLGFFSNRDPDANYDSIRTNEDHRDPSSKSTLVHAISNGIAFQSPVWSKVSLGINSMADCLKSQINNVASSRDAQAKLEESLFSLLSETNNSTEEIHCNIMIRPHHRVNSTETEISGHTWYGTRTQTIMLVSRTTPTKVTFIERDAFRIEPNDQAEDKLGKPVWLGDQLSQWRRFEFELLS